MATTVSQAKAFAAIRQPTLPASRYNPLVLWHLLSLDAPTVAAVWTWFLARANHVPLPATSIVAIAIAVWVLYAADRLLDTRSVRHDGELEERHFFHRSNRRLFVLGMVVAAVALAVLLPRLSAHSLRLYLVLGSLLFVYFILIHSSANSRRLPKELAVGVFFSAATFIPTVSRQPDLRPALLPAAVLFSVLCSLNCLFIYAWEHPVQSPFTHPATRAALRFLPEIALAASSIGLILCFADPQLHWQVPAACALSASLLLMLHQARARFAPTTLRAAADLCLLAPVLLAPLLNR